MPIHVVPVNDLIEHDTDGGDCICGPDHIYIDPETGDPFSSGPIVSHHSLDGRELTE
jgi:hypothetical protein